MGHVLHSWVLIAKEVEDNFIKMIRVVNRRLNITLLTNYRFDFPVVIEVMLRPGLRYTHGADPRPARRKPVLLPGYRPWMLLGSIPGDFLPYCPGLVPLWSPRAWGGTFLLNLPHSQSMLQTSLSSQRASHCLWNYCSGSRFPVPHASDSQLINQVQGSPTEMTTGATHTK